MLFFEGMITMDIMTEYTIQYLLSPDSGGAVSDWPEYSRKIKALNRNKALALFHHQQQFKGSNPYVILDCFHNA